MDECLSFVVAFGGSDPMYHPRALAPLALFQMLCFVLKRRRLQWKFDLAVSRGAGGHGDSRGDCGRGAVIAGLQP